MWICVFAHLRTCVVEPLRRGLSLSSLGRCEGATLRGRFVDDHGEENAVTHTQSHRRMHTTRSVLVSRASPRPRPPLPPDPTATSPLALSSSLLIATLMGARWCAGGHQRAEARVGRRGKKGEGGPPVQSHMCGVCRLPSSLAPPSSSCLSASPRITHTHTQTTAFTRAPSQRSAASPLPALHALPRTVRRCGGGVLSASSLPPPPLTRRLPNSRAC